MDVNDTRLALLEQLGENSGQYFATMKSWFKSKYDLKLSKEDFDRVAFELMENDVDKMKFHNNFICAIVTKCQLRPTPPPIFSSKPARKRMRKTTTFQNRLPKIEMVGVAEGSSAYPPNLDPSQNEMGVLPDLGSIHANCLLNCWKHDLSDVDAQVTHIVWISVRTLLLNVLQCCIEMRRAYCTHPAGMNHSFGTNKRSMCYPRGVVLPASPIGVSDVLAVMQKENNGIAICNSILVPFIEKCLCLLAHPDE